MRINIGDKLPNSELFYLDQNNDVKKLIYWIFAEARQSF